MSPDIQNQILEWLKTAMSAIGALAPEVWTMLVRQQMLAGIVGLVQCLTALFTGLYIMISFAKKSAFQSEEKARWKLVYRRTSDLDEERNAEAKVESSDFYSWVFGIVAIVGGCLLLGGLLGFFIGGGDMIMHIANPQYYAIMDLIHSVSGK